MLSRLKKYSIAVVLVALVIALGWLWYEERLPFINEPEPEIVGQVGYWDDGETDNAATRFLVECRIRNTGRSSSVSISALIRGDEQGFLREFADVSVPRNETESHTFTFERADRLAARPASPNFECLLGSRSSATVEPTATEESDSPTP